MHFWKPFETIVCRAHFIHSEILFLRLHHVGTATITVLVAATFSRPPETHRAASFPRAIIECHRVFGSRFASDLQVEPRPAVYAKSECNRGRLWQRREAAARNGDARADFLKFLILFVSISSISRGCVSVQASPLWMFIQTCFKFRFKVLSVLLSRCLFLFPPRIPTQVSVCVYFPTR